MAPYKTPDGVHRWRKTIIWPKGSGRKHSSSGTPSAVGLPNTEAAAIGMEQAWVLTITHPEIAAAKERLDAEERAKHVAKSLRVRPDLLVSAVAPRFIAGYIPERGGRSEGANDFRNNNVRGHIVPFFGNVPINGITQELIDTFKRDQRHLRSSTVSSRLGTLRTMIEYARTRLFPEITDWPALNFKIAKEKGAPVRGLEHAELTALLKHARTFRDPILYVAVLLAADAGLRVGEIRGLQFGDVRDGHITITRQVDPRGRLRNVPKSKEPRVVPMTDRLIAAVKALPKRGLWIMTPKKKSDGGSYVKYDTLRRWLLSAYAAAGIEITEAVSPWHSLRHTCATELDKLGVPLRTIQAWLGHEDRETTMRYIDAVKGRAELDVARAALNRR